MTLSILDGVRAPVRTFFPSSAPVIPDGSHLSLWRRREGSRCPVRCAFADDLTVVGIWRRFKDTCCKELTFIQKEAGWLRREEDNCATVQEWMYLQVLLCGINVRAVFIMYGCTHPYIRNVKNRDYEQVAFYLHKLRIHRTYIVCMYGYII